MLLRRKHGDHGCDDRRSCICGPNTRRIRDIRLRLLLLSHNRHVLCRLSAGLQRLRLECDFGVRLRLPVAMPRCVLALAVDFLDFGRFDVIQILAHLLQVLLARL